MSLSSLYSRRIRTRRTGNRRLNVCRRTLRRSSASLRNVNVLNSVQITYSINIEEILHEYYICNFGTLTCFTISFLLLFLIKKYRRKSTCRVVVPMLGVYHSQHLAHLFSGVYREWPSSYDWAYTYIHVLVLGTFQNISL